MISQGDSTMTAIRSLPQHIPAPQSWDAATYERLARNPYAPHHFHRGPYYARHYLGYPDSDLQGVPRVARDRFAGVGNPFVAGEIHAGETVLDLGCGAGTELLIAARRVGPTGRVIGLDGSPAMRRCAQMAVGAAGFSDRVEIQDGRFEALPLENGRVDLVIANGTLGSSEQKALVFSEIRRVLKPGGRLYLAELVMDQEPAFNPPDAADPSDAFLAGVTTAEELIELAARAGLRKGHLITCYDCLRNAPAADWVTRGVRVHGAIFTAVKAEGA
jgi:arsenite methyltransferase